MEKYYYKYIQRFNGKHEKRKPVGDLNTKMETIKKSQIEVLEQKIIVFKLKTLLDILKTISAKEKISETKDSNRSYLNGNTK